MPLFPAGLINMNCDMCGKETMLFKTDVEGSILSLCKGCSKFGKVISVVKVEQKERKSKSIRQGVFTTRKKEEEFILAIVPDYGGAIKKKREQLGMNQEDFAKKINEKRALIHKIEIGHFEPPMDLARKIEKFLHIKLIDQQEIEPTKVDKAKGEGFTIGDFIKVKR